MTIRNLVFQGGGVKGIAYVGAIDVLEQRGLMSHVNYVAGTSAGSITAALLAMGATSQDLDRILRDTAFSSFEDGGWWIIGDAVRLLSSYGIYKGEAFEKWLRQQISLLTERATGQAQPDVTFGQLRTLAAQKPGVFRELYTVSTNLTRQHPDDGLRPDAGAARAARQQRAGRHPRVPRREGGSRGELRVDGTGCPGGTGLALQLEVVEQRGVQRPESGSSPVTRLGPDG